MTIAVRSVSFSGDGSCVVEYLDSDHDVKENGLLLNHVAYLPAEPYEDEIDDVMGAILRMVESFTVDRDRLGPPPQPQDPDNDDEDD